MSTGAPPTDAQSVGESSNSTPPHSDEYEPSPPASPSPGVEPPSEQPDLAAALEAIEDTQGLPPAVEAAPGHARSAAHAEARRELEEIKELRRRLKEAELRQRAAPRWPFIPSFERSDSEDAGTERLVAESTEVAARSAVPLSTVAGASAGAAAAGVATSVAHANACSSEPLGPDAWTAVAVAAATAAAVAATAGSAGGTTFGTDVAAAAAAAAASAAAASGGVHAQPDAAATAAAAATANRAALECTCTLPRFREACDILKPSAEPWQPAGRAGRFNPSGRLERGGSPLDQLAGRARDFRKKAELLAAASRASHPDPSVRPISRGVRRPTSARHHCEVYGHTAPCSMEASHNISVKTALA
jgi:hypothetical protein